MNRSLSPFDTVQRTISLLKERFMSLHPLVGILFVAFFLAGLARNLFPGLYVFSAFDQGWLLIPEALAIGPLVAMIHHRMMGLETDFAFSRDDLLVKSFKSAAYYYALFVLFKLGLFTAMELLPALAVYVLGPAIGGLIPLLTGLGSLIFLLFFSRLVVVYPALASGVREAMITSILLTKGKGRQIASSLLLLAAPVLIPWVGATVYGGDWLNPSRGSGLLIVPIIVRSFLLTVGAIVISTGLCTIYKVLAAIDEEAQEARIQRSGHDQDD